MVKTRPAANRRDPPEPVRRPMGWGAVLYTHIVIIGLPTILLYFLRLSGYDLFPLHAAVATAYLITSVMILVETTIAAARRFAASVSRPEGTLDRLGRRLKSFLGVTGARRPEPSRPVPRCSIVVVAYLPNEQEIIRETLEHILATIERPEAGLELLLAYNTPVRLPVEEELAELAERNPELKLLHVEDSESKAENLNAALEVVTGEVTAILDADHHPRADCLERAWRWLDGEYDVVQGRSIIRNYGINWLTKLIGVEFECMYGISHPARSLFVDTAVFGGSNGYWKTEALRKIRFDRRMMTEDIDASVRALLEGYRIVADRSIISTELAPTDFRSFWFQRKRWAQGWLQCSLRYQRPVWKSGKLNLAQKLYWTYLLYYRELYPIVSLQIFPIIFSLILYQGSMPLITHWYLWFTALVTLVSGPYQTLSATKNSVTGFPFGYAIAYSFLVFFYVMLKHVIWILAFYDHLHGNSDWVVTRRALSEEIRRRSEGA